jgi:hypothetical protein
MSKQDITLRLFLRQTGPDVAGRNETVTKFFGRSEIVAGATSGLPTIRELTLNSVRQVRFRYLCHSVEMKPCGEGV